MNNIDFSECEFINYEMRIYTYNDFCDNRREIKKLFNSLSPNGKRFYMWYIYANTHMKNNFKNQIWNFLNDYCDETDLIYLKKFYTAN